MGATSDFYATPVPTPDKVVMSRADGTIDPGWLPGGGSGASYVPVTTGAEPVELVSDGAGSLILVPYTP